MAPGRSRLAGALAIVAIAGCGGDGAKPDLTPRKSASVTRAVEAARDRTMQVRMTRSGTIPDHGDYSFEGEGTARADGSRGVMRGDLVALDGSELHVEVRFDGPETWVAAPQLGLPRGKRWLRSDKTLVLDRAVTPWNLLDVMAAAYDITEAPGGHQVEGEPARHYRGLADVATLRKSVPELAVGGDPRERVPVELWIAEGRPKRLLMDFDSRLAAFRYDAVVLGYEDEEIPAPPPERVTIDADEPR